MDGEDVISESKSYQAAGGSEDGAVPSPSQSAGPSAEQQQDSGGGADGDASSNAKAKGRGNFRKDQCQVEGCSTDLLQEGKAYCVKRRLCNAHMRADQVTCRDREGLWRFCFQCGKLEPLSRFEGNKRSCKLRLAQRKQRETRRCSSDLAYKFNRPQQGGTARGQQAIEWQTSSGGNSAGARLAGLMEDMPQELLPLELQQQQALLLQQLQEYSSAQQHQGEGYCGVKQEPGQQWYQQAQQHSMPLPQLTMHHSLASAATGYGSVLAPVAEERPGQPAFQSQSMPLPVLCMDSITSTAAAAATAAAAGALSLTAGVPSIAGRLMRHSSDVSYHSHSAALPAASFGAAAAAAASCGCSHPSQAQQLSERQLQQLQVQQQMQQLKSLQQQMQAMVSSWPAAAAAAEASEVALMMQRQQQHFSQAGGSLSGPLPAAPVLHQGMKAAMQGRAAPVSGPLPTLSGQGLGLSGPLPTLSGLSAPGHTGCHGSAPLPAVSLGAADAASGQLSTVGGSTASALAGGIKHLLELIDEGDEDEEEHQNDQALPFTDTDLRSMLEGALESASVPPASQQQAAQAQQQQQFLQLQQLQQLQRHAQQQQQQALQAQQQQALQAQQQQQALQQQLLQELQELRPIACSSQTWHASGAQGAAHAHAQVQMQLQAQQLAAQQQQSPTALLDAGPAAAIRAALQQKLQRIHQLQRMLLQQDDAEFGIDDIGDFLKSGLGNGLNSSHGSGNWQEMVAAAKPGAAAALGPQVMPQALQSQQTPQLQAAQTKQPEDSLMLDADMLQAQLQQLQQQCTSLKEEINRTKQRSSQDPASVSCC